MYVDRKGEILFEYLLCRHSWETGRCEFHPQRVCSCNSCREGELQCKGKEYNSKSTLTCPLDALLYEIECKKRATNAHRVIYPELGKGHTNLCESTFSIRPQFRSSKCRKNRKYVMCFIHRNKSSNYQRLHCMTSTNLGLLQANMTWATKTFGDDYSWVIDLFQRLELPVFHGMNEALRKAREKQWTSKMRKKTTPVKAARVRRKRDRSKETEKRKTWVKKEEFFMIMERRQKKRMVKAKVKRRDRTSQRR